jgi:hypothetical protein
MELNEVTYIPAPKTGLKEMSQHTKDLIEMVETKMVLGRIYVLEPADEAEFKKTKYSLLTVKKRFPNLEVNTRGKKIYLTLTE